MKTYIFGHKKPDLDSVVAALSFTEYCKLNKFENPISAIIEPINAETKFVFDKFQIPAPTQISLSDILPEDRVVLVDHNEVEQRLDGLNPEQIVAIYDHHKVNISFTRAIEIITLTLGSSNTVAWTLFKNHNYSLDQNLAKLMLSAILSDTVGLKSSTTTDTDKQAVANLANIAGITDIDALTLEIFKAKSNVSALSNEQIVLNDYKIFELSGKKLLIGQTETVEQETLLNTHKAGLLSAMSKIKTEQNVDYLYLCLTDILKINTKILIIGESEKALAEKAFGVSVVDSIQDIGPKMSRKKDILPVIEQALAN